MEDDPQSPEPVPETPGADAAPSAEPAAQTPEADTAESPEPAADAAGAAAGEGSRASSPAHDPLYPAIVAIVAVCLALALSWAGMTRGERLGYGSPDDSMFIQLCWNTLNGAPLRLSHEAWTGAPDRSYYASHLNLLFVLYLPVFAIAPGFKILCALKPALSLLGALPLFVFARRRTQSGAMAAAVAVLFMLHPLVSYNSVRLSSNYLTFALLLLGIERLDAGKLRAAAVCFVLAVCGREEISLQIAGLLLPIAVLAPKRRRWALGVSACLLAFTFFYVGFLKGQFGEGPDHFARFHHLGASLPAVALSPLLRPQVFFGHLFGSEALLLGLLLALPLGPAVALGPRYLIAGAAPWVIVAISAVDSDRIFGPYLVPTIPFLYAALVDALARLGERPARKRWQLVALTLAALLTGASWLSDAGILRRYQAIRALSPTPLSILAAANPEYPAVLALAQSIPSDLSVSASNAVLVHVACRRYLYPFPIRAQEVDVVLVDRRADSVYNPRWPAIAPSDYTAAVEALLREPGVKIVEAGRFLLVDRRGVSGPKIGRD